MPDRQSHMNSEELAKLIRQYLAGELDDRAMHQLERQALDDPFLAEALEGYEQHNPDQRIHQQALNEALNKRVTEKPQAGSGGKIRTMYRMVAAAAIILLMGLGWYLVEQTRKETPNVAAVQPEKAVPADTAPTPAPSLAAADSYKEKADSPDQANKPAKQMGRVAPKPSAPVPAPMAEVAKAAKTVAAEQQAEVADSTSAGLLSGKIAGVEVQDSNKHLNEVVIGYASQPKYDSVNGDLAGSNNGKVVIRGNSSLNETVVVRGVKAGKRPADEEASTADYVSPVPVNGEAAYERYLKSSIKNPYNVKGTVKVSFVVMPDGSLQDFRIKNHLSKECDEEAIRLIKEGPAWKPSSDGKPTRVTRKIRFVAGKNQE